MKLCFLWRYQRECELDVDSVAEWLRRWIANPLLSERASSNLATVEFLLLRSLFLTAYHSSSLMYIYCAPKERGFVKHSMAENKRRTKLETDFSLQFHDGIHLDGCHQMAGIFSSGATAAVASQCGAQASGRSDE